MNNQIVTLIFFVAAVILYIIFLWQEKRKIFMYKFFALRDQLYRLAIEEKINENSTTFRELSLMLNVTIAHSKKFKLISFIRTLEERKISEPDKNKLFFKDLENQSDDVKRIAEEFFNNFFTLLIRNHPMLFIFIHIRFLLTIIPSLKQQVFTALSYKNSGEKVKLALGC
ncbi:MAG: hypothetical protein A2068_03020 [Ignavibacteria bacterium GWB2_35_6b]|nr:MAG: hypothetical protein A2068_03020 [Ignavibacteria bacterium GWB2_35_6b]